MHGRAALTAMTAFLIALHLGTAAAVTLFFDWQWLLLTLVCWQFFALIGISVCLHRDVTHRAFRSARPLRLFHLICATVAGQAGPVLWATVHRAHHRHSDTELDPGFLYLRAAHRLGLVEFRCEASTTAAQP